MSEPIKVVWTKQDTFASMHDKFLSLVGDHIKNLKHNLLIEKSPSSFLVWSVTEIKESIIWAMPNCINVWSFGVSISCPNPYNKNEEVLYYTLRINTLRTENKEKDLLGTEVQPDCHIIEYQI